MIAEIQIKEVTMKMPEHSGKFPNAILSSLWWKETKTILVPNSSDLLNRTVLPVNSNVCSGAVASVPQSPGG